MSVEKLTYVDSSAIVKLVVREPESRALLRYVRHRALIASALARTEVARALLHFGDLGLARAKEALARIDLVRINDRVLANAGELRPPTLRSLDAVHLATVLLLGSELKALVTYDDRMALAARAMGFRVVAPS